MNYYYTDEINTLLLMSLLKKHHIKKIIASPGTTNISFVASVQNDKFFEVYSAVDERAAAFMACGLSEESGEPVVITCTGATASRNYIPGLTEAFYRHLPILAVTFTQHVGRVGNYVAQVIDRSKQFADMCKMSATIPMIYSRDDKQFAITKINEVILEITHNSAGPCHLNMVTAYSNNFTVKSLPDCRVISRHNLKNMPILQNRKIGIFVGSHLPFSDDETKAIDKFCESNNAIVISDHIGNYHGKYKFRSSLIGSQNKDFGLKTFEIIIYIGYVHGAYLPFLGKELWRVNPDGVVRDPFNNLTKVFEMPEIDFFKYYTREPKDNTLLETAKVATQAISSKMPELPFSNLWIAKETAGFIPDNSVLHFGILNTLRAWNYFSIDDSIDCFSNTGGYGIDGCLSSFLGAANQNPGKEFYLIIGDLSFFYDVSSLLNNITPNIHIMLINNGIGTEFKNYNHRASYFGEDANSFIAAKGHNGYKNQVLVASLCKDLGIRYLSSKTKNDYLKIRDEWIKKQTSPVLIEAFTNDKDESEALKKINTICNDTSLKGLFKKSALGKILRRIKR